MEYRSTNVDALRERILQYIGGLEAEDLVSAAQHLGFTEDADPRIIHYPGGKIKLTTDAPEIQPYLPRTPQEDERAWLDEVRLGLEDVRAGRTRPFNETLSELRAKYLK